MLIGEIAKKTGLSIHTVRYYEKLGLFKVSSRRNNNYKEYPEGTADILIFVVQAKNLGFTIGEIKDVIELYRDTTHTEPAILKLVSKKLAKIEEKITHLTRIKKALNLILENKKDKKYRNKKYDFQHLVDEIKKYSL
jgi:DNA-binding transcriptional MerR regulator